MKKPLINLTAIERIDAVPLSKALELYQKGAGEVAAARVRETNLQKEIEDFLATVSPDDDKAMQTISAKKIQAEILPRLIQKLEHNLDSEVLPRLMSETDTFRDGLRRFYSEAHNAIATQIAEVFRPYFAAGGFAVAGESQDRALTVARQTDDCQTVNARLHELGLPPCSGSASGVSPRLSEPHRVTDLVATAKALLELAKRD